MAKNAKPGDKVRLKNDPFRNQRGIVETVQAKSLVVRLQETGESVTVPVVETTNFSLAARKAWDRMPDRRVGRPKGSVTTDRISVTLRIDRELWERFREAENAGLVADRTSTINTWIAEKLNKLTE